MIAQLLLILTDMISIESMTEGIMMTERGHDLPPTELPSQKVLDKGLHDRAADNAQKAAAAKHVEEPDVATHLDELARDLHEIAEAGEKPLDHIDPKDSYVAEAVHSTARLLDSPRDQERPITYTDFQQETVRTDSGYTTRKRMEPANPEFQKKIEILESVLGAGMKHEVPADENNLKIEEAPTNLGVKLREVTDREGNVRMSVIKNARNRMQPPVIR